MKVHFHNAQCGIGCDISKVPVSLQILRCRRLCYAATVTEISGVLKCKKRRYIIHFKERLFTFDFINSQHSRNT